MTRSRTRLATLLLALLALLAFLTGQWVQRYPVRSARLGSEHVIGNHTVSHPDLTTLSDAAVRAQITTAQTQITRATGQDPRRFFRFPYGARDARAA